MTIIVIEKFHTGCLGLPCFAKI